MMMVIVFPQVLQEAAREKMAAQLAGPGLNSSSTAAGEDTVRSDQGESVSLTQGYYIIQGLNEHSCV